MDQQTSTSSGPALQRAQEASQDRQVITGRSSGAVVAVPQPASRKQHNPKKAVPCRFFPTKQGCRAGEACPYLHDQEAAVVTTAATRDGRPSDLLPQAGNGSNGSSAKAEDQAKVEGIALPFPVPHMLRTPMARPIAPQQQAHPREFEITQLKRRFSPTVREEEHATVLLFKLVPSDPDFPFELNALETALTVPKTYPSNGRPTISISNPEMERGYQINVERGFDELVRKFPTKKLLSLMNELDKNLEDFLVSRKAATVKLIANTDKAPLQRPPPVPQALPTPETVQTMITPVKKSYTSQQIEEARLRRTSQIRQIEARLGRQPLYSKSSDGSTFNIPLLIPKMGRLPASLQSMKDVRLLVPPLYPLEPCTIRLREGSIDATLVELAFEKHATQYPEMTLMAHVNNLSQNMHLMARPIVIAPEENVIAVSAATSMAVESDTTPPAHSPPRMLDVDQPHLQVIARPPEWNQTGPESDDEDTDLSDSDFSESDNEEHGGADLTDDNTSTAVASGPERGILLSFPMLELYSIELLQITSLSLTLRCDRCKTTMDLMNIKPATAEATIPRRADSCKKCASSLSVAYRAEAMHMNSIRAGFLDLEACTVVDLLPSHFQPTCSDCSTTLAAPGIVSVRGEASMAVCRECHQKMTFKLPEVRFLRVSSAERPTRPLPRKRPKEHLGIVAGTELPRRGRCSHYAKSYRWFRFGCCQKVYACDRCHDAAEEHANEHAARMICGLCSREQHYRPEDCAFCHSGLVGKKSGGFWEGGKGTRDKTRMSRKDPRKYKRRGGGAVGAKAK